MESDYQTVFTGGGMGYQVSKKGGVATFKVEGMEELDALRENKFTKIYQRYINENYCVRVGEYQVPIWGDGHNLYPQELAELIDENKLLPGILRKQEDFLYGKGPVLYREVVEDGKTVRQSVTDQEIQWWLESWEANGYQDYRDYLRCLIQDYYRTRTCISQYHFSRGRRSARYQQGSIRALTYVGSDRARLATKDEVKYLGGKPMSGTVDEFPYVMVGNWWQISGSQSYDVYHRFVPSEPYAHPAAIAFNAMKSFGRWIYAYNDWFSGLKEWVKASNLTPKYLNSYLKNALNAHIHVQIPQSWVAAHRQALEELCRLNLMETKEENRTNEYKGVKLIDPDTKRPYRFSVNMVEDLIANELEKVTSLLSGEGKNQGKLYATTKLGDEGWTFEDFPGKFKEYFESVISYDKRADQVTLASIGINSSITNVENDGVISKSGSDVYYNYMVYLNSLSYAEHFICKEINRAIALNFPDKAAQGIRLGFRIDVPLRQQEIAPKDRL